MPRKKRVTHEAVPQQEELRQPKVVFPLNKEQTDYIKCIHRNDIIIALGKAGTGKSYCCAGLAAEYLNRKLVDKIIICRSAAQADKIGFVPGDGIEKTLPYITQVLVDMGDFLSVKKELAEGRIEVLSLAFVRGRSFRNSFIILEEGQNCTYPQLKMFITRIGDSSKMVISGDITQSDLEDRHAGDFADFIHRMETIAVPDNKIAIVELKRSVRHPIIETILKALETP